MSTPLSGRSLRYLLTTVLADAGRPLTVVEMVAELHALGFHVAGRSGKTISDSLRWEIAKGRVVRITRSTYAAGTMPRSTAHWIRQQIRALAA